VMPAEVVTDRATVAHASSSHERRPPPPRRRRVTLVPRLERLRAALAPACALFGYGLC
jgi:hypothetical protein